MFSQLVDSDPMMKIADLTVSLMEGADSDAVHKLLRSQLTYAYLRGFEAGCAERLTPTPAQN